MTTAFPAVSATVAALIGLLAVFLTFRVIALRVRLGVNAGDGGHAALAQAIRAQANLLELAPLALLLLAFAEWSIAWRGLIVALGVLLLVARLASAWGLSHSLELGSARKAGAGLTALVIVACSALILYRMLLML
jgi:uncharacterized membrane protein YecN with MAPEG domain